jgi:hypothetical protein
VKPPAFVYFKQPWTTPSLKGQGAWYQSSHARRTARLRADTKTILLSVSLTPPAPPWRLIVTRGNASEATGPGLDAHDNLRLALSAVVDGAADYLRIADNDPRLTIHYQKAVAPRGKPFVSVKIETHDAMESDPAALRELVMRTAALAMVYLPADDAAGWKLLGEVDRALGVKARGATR